MKREWNQKINCAWSAESVTRVTKWETQVVRMTFGTKMKAGRNDETYDGREECGKGLEHMSWDTSLMERQSCDGVRRLGGGGGRAGVRRLVDLVNV